MEKLPTNEHTATIGELFAPPFDPVTIARNLGPYGKWLELQPNVAAAPNPEFLVRLLTGHASHKACLRHVAGNQFKNVENWLRGRHQSSRTTRSTLISTLGIDATTLDSLKGSSPDGPLMPILLTLFQSVEGVSTFMAKGLLAQEVPCKCCGRNLMDDADAWWVEHAPNVGKPEWHLVERLLNAIVGASLVEMMLASFNVITQKSLGHLDRLAASDRHPIGNWLAEVQEAMSCRNLADMACATQLRPELGDGVEYGRLKKWSSGSDVMPMADGMALMGVSGQSQGIILRLMVARTLAMTMDFVEASWTGPQPDKQRVRKVVCGRLQTIITKTRLASATV